MEKTIISYEFLEMLKMKIIRNIHLMENEYVIAEHEADFFKNIRFKYKKKEVKICLVKREKK